MKKLKKNLDNAIDILGPEIKGKVPEHLYHFLRRYGPMLCVDVVLVPIGKKPTVLLAKRAKNAVAPGQWYIIGGRVQKKGKLLETIHERVWDELHLTYKIETHEVIGFGLPTFPPNKKEKTRRDYTVFTPTICFAHRIPSVRTIEQCIIPSAGNVDWKIFDTIDPKWDSYVVKAVAHAWDHYYGKSWKRKISKELREMLKDYSDFIPLKFDP